MLNLLKIELGVRMRIDTNTHEANSPSDVAQCERIKILIESYLSKNERLTLQSVATKTSVPMSSLRRIINLNGIPSSENVIKICRALGFDLELELYLNKYHPEIASLIASKNTHNKEYEYLKENESQYFTEEPSFLILSLAYTTAGVTEEEIRYEFGERGVDKLIELVEKGLLVSSDSIRYFGRTQGYKLPFADIKKEIELALKCYRLDEAGTSKNWMSYQTESLNDEGLFALKALNQKQFNERKELIFNNPQYLGNKTVFSASVTSTFVKCKETEVQQ